MSANTSIEWTDETDNIIVAKHGGWWCRMISPGCVNCYAAELNKSSIFGGNKLPYTGDPPEMVLRHDLIDGWKRKTKPKRHFVCSMTDVFGEWVTRPMAVTFLRGMWAAPTQTFQVLTKRPEVALDRIAHWLALDGLRAVPNNIWIGVSVENQQRADERIPQLLTIAAKTRFLSVEPLLGPVDLCQPWQNQDFTSRGDTLLENLDWVIVGGESGRQARPCKVEWIRSVVRQCQKAGVPCFVKQLGAHVLTDNANLDDWPDGTKLVGQGEGFAAGRAKLHDKKGGDMAEFPEDLRVREFPETQNNWQARQLVLQP